MSGQLKMGGMTRSWEERVLREWLVPVLDLLEEGRGQGVVEPNRKIPPPPTSFGICPVGRLGRIHPSVEFKIKEWAHWHTSLGCNSDFIEYPPLLQFGKEFICALEVFELMKCVICSCLCPPPPYGCSKGHILCFSCTSVLRGCACPIMQRLEGHVEKVLCGEVLKPMNIPKFEKLFPEPRAEYQCPFKVYGCPHSESFLPIDLVQHAQEHCPLRFAVQCVIDGCEGQKEPIRIGYFAKHMIENHKARKIDLDLDTSNTSPPVIIHYDSNQEEDIYVPIVFADEKKRLLFPLIMKKTKKFVYLWMYSIFQRDVKRDIFQGRIMLRHKRKTTNWIAHDVIHDPGVSNKDVIKTGRLMKLTISDFENNFVRKFLAEPKDGLGKSQNYLSAAILRFALLETENENESSSTGVNIENAGGSEKKEN